MNRKKSENKLGIGVGGSDLDFIWFLTLLPLTIKQGFRLNNEKTFVCI